MIDALVTFGELLRDRLIAAAPLPDLAIWGTSLGLLGLYGLIAIPFGLWRGLLRWEPIGEIGDIAATLLIALVYPSLLEEILFRVFWLPHPSESPSIATFLVWSVLALAVIIAAHPFNAWIFLPSRRDTFYNPTFLGLAGLLGGVCTLAYGLSGSLWPPVILHWAIVVIWLLLLGGQGRLAQSA